MLSRTRARAAAIAIVATAGHTAGGQEPPRTEIPSFAAQLDVILVGAVVTDRQGRPVKGLKAEDFVLREDGAPQLLTSFEAVDLPLQASGGSGPPAAAEAPRTSTNAGADSQHPRVFLLAMDDAGLGLDGAATAKRVAKQFLSGAVRPGDRVSLVAPGVGINWSVGHPEGTGRLAAILDSVQGLRARASEESGDWDAMRAAEALDSLAVERVRLGLDGAGLLPTETRLPGESPTSYAARNRALQNPYARMNARRQLDQDRERRQELYAAVERALSAVAAVKGRKTVLLFSEGFIREPDDPPFRTLLTAARQSDASIYFVNVLRLSSGMTAETRQPRERSSRSRGVDANETGGAEQVADETGGFSLQNPNDLEAGLARIARESASYYLLGYSPLNTKRDGTGR